MHSYISMSINCSFISTEKSLNLNPNNLRVFPESQQCPQPVVSQVLQSTMDRPLPGEIKDETLGCTHVRAGSGNERGVDQVKIETIGSGTSRQASGPPNQGYSKYQKSLPPRFQRQQQVQTYTSIGYCLKVL